MEKQATVGKQLFQTRELVTMAFFAAILSVSAYISIPLPFPGSPHITLLNFVILLIALLFPAAQSFLIILVWMLLGIVGVPVFIGGKATIAYLLNPWGGYTLVFLLISVLLPLIRGQKYNRIRYTATAVIGALLIDFLGMVYLRLYPGSGYDWKMAFSVGFVAFLPLDLLKSVVVAQIIPPLKRVMPDQM